MVQVTRFVPKNSLTASVTAVDQKPCADGYSGWFTVRSGAHVGSGSVSGLPSLPARGMAVRGRHALKQYLASYPAIAPSAADVCTIANNRAVSATVRPRLMASS